MAPRSVYRFLRLLAAVSLLASQALAAPGGMKLKARIVNEPDSFDWNLNLATTASPIFNNIMEGLFELNAKLELKPRLARSVTVSPDRLSYELKLRPGVVWSDGRPLKAQDFVDSWKRLLDPRVGSAYSYFLFKIDGAEAFHRGKAEFSKVGIKAPDELTIRVKLREPCPYFLQLLTMRLTFPIRADLLKQAGGRWADPERIVALGPFLIARRIATPGAPIRFVLKRNPKYFDARPQLEEIELVTIADPVNAVAAYEKGQVDFVSQAGQAGLAFKGAKDLGEAPLLQTLFLYFNTRQYPFSLLKVRQAIAHAIDQAKLAPTFAGFAKPALSMVPPEVLPGLEVGHLPFDPEKARKLLKEVGLDPKSMPKIEITTVMQKDDQPTLQAVQSELQHNLGVPVELKTYPYQQFRLHVVARQGGLVYYSWAADFNDPDTFLQTFLSGAGSNRAAWSNPEFDAILRKASSLPNGPERAKAYSEALQLIIKKDAVVIPIAHARNLVLKRPGLSGIEVNPLGQVFFRNARDARPQ